MHDVLVAAADTPTDFDPVGFFLSYGVLGAVVVLAILGYVTFKPDVSRLERLLNETRERFDKQVAELRKDYTDQIANLRKDHTDEVAQLRTERDKAIEQRNEMASTFQKEWLPALVKSLQTIEVLRALMERVVDRGGGER